MKLLLVLAVTLAFSLAEEFDIDEESIDDLQAAASMDLQRNTDQWVAPNRYVPNRPSWNPTSNNYNPVIPSAPSNNYNTAIPPAPIPSRPTSQGGYFPVQSDYSYWPQNNNNNNPPPTNSWDNQNSWNNNQNQNTWNNPQTQKPQNQPVDSQQNNWNNQQTTGSQNTWTKPQNPGSQNTGQTGSQNWNNQNTNNWNNWNQTPSSITSTTTPVSVIKNEHIQGENGSYKYEYEIADGTHVAEEGYILNPNTEAETLVKKGFYSFTAGDGKVYSVTYWADETGFHAIGDHLPKPPPVPPAIQAAIDQNAKEEAAKAEAEKNKQQQQQQGYYPQGQETPKPIQPQPIQPQQPVQYPQQTYYPNQQQTYYPPTNYYPPQAGYGRRR